jgi:hypothetical protein
MNDLLNLAMKAHGGLERWKQVRNMQAKVTLNGTLWQIKGRPDGLSGVVMRLKEQLKSGQPMFGRTFATYASAR